MSDEAADQADDASPRTVAEAGERAVIELLRGPEAEIGDDPVGNGDDAAVLGAASATVVTTDMLVEGTHFRFDFSTPTHVGERAIAQNAADVLAMGAECSRILVAVCLPPETPLELVRQLAAGLHVGSRRVGARIIGGDVTTGSLVVVTVTALGVLPEGAAPVRIDTARKGDVIALTGRPGRSAAGLDLLQAGHHRGTLQDAYRVPTPPVGAGVDARVAGAHALTDVSDGLLRDLSGIMRASGLAARLDSAALGEDPDLEAASALLGPGSSPRSWQLDGGEDHGLLATFPAGIELPASFRAVGRVVDGTPGAVAVDGEPVTPGGWDSARGRGAHE